MATKQSGSTLKPSRTNAAKRRERRKKAMASKVVSAAVSSLPGNKPKLVKPATPRPKSVRRPPAAEPPRRMAIEGQTNLEHKLSYGPPIAYDHRGSVGDSRVVINVTSDVKTNLPNVLCGILAFAQSRLTLSNSPIQWNYVYKFLFNWVKYRWAGRVPTYDLTEAPAVLWDIVHAGTSRRKGRISVVVEESTENLLAPSTASTGNCPMGAQAGQIGVGNYVVTVSLASYTEALGFKSTVDLFARCADVLDVVPSSYRRIAEDDLSMFTNATPFNVSMVAFGFNVNNATTNNNAQEVFTLEKPRCEWLSRLTMFYNSLEIAGGVGLTTTCSAAAIVVDRIMQKLRGYDAHQRNVLIKPIDFSWILRAVDNVLYNACINAGYPDPGTANPFQEAGLGFYDYRHCLYTAVTRWCSSWVAVCAGYRFPYPDENNYKNAIGVGTGATPSRLAEQLHMIECFEKALSHLYPYYLKQKNLMVFPIPYMSTDMTNSPAGIGFTVGGFGFTSWDLTTNLAASTYEVAAFSSAFTASTFQAWNKAVQKLQQSIPFSVRKEESPINLTVLTRRHDPSAPTAAFGLYSHGNIPDHVNQELDGAILPQIFRSMTGSGLLTNFYQVLTGETNYEGYSIVASTGGNSVNVYDLLETAWYPSIHVLGGAGDKDAIVDNDEEEIIAEEEEERERKEKRAGGVLNAIKDTAEKGAEFFADEDTQKAFTTLMTLMKAASIVP